MNYRVILSPHAERDLDRFRGRTYLRLQAAIDASSKQPTPARLPENDRKRRVAHPCGRVSHPLSH